MITARDAQRGSDAELDMALAYGCGRRRCILRALLAVRAVRPPPGLERAPIEWTRPCRWNLDQPTVQKVSSVLLITL